MRIIGFALTCICALSLSAQAGISFVAERDTVYSTAQTAFRVTRPTALIFDLCVHVMIKGDDISLTGFPTGFTTMGTSNGTTGFDEICGAAYRIISNSEANTVDTTTSGTGDEWSGGTASFRGIDGRWPRQVWGFGGHTQNVADPVCASVTTQEDSTLVIFFAGTTDTSTAATVTDPSGVTRLWVRKDVSGDFWNSSFCGYLIQATPGATGTKTWDLNTTVTTAEVNTFTVAFRPDSDNKYRVQRLNRSGARQFRKMLGRVQ